MGQQSGATSSGDTQSVGATSDWNQLARDYSGLPFSTEWSVGYPTVIELLGDLAGKRILDYGCGEGKFSRALAAGGAEVLGVDISPEMIERAKRADGERTQFQLINSDDLSEIPSGSFDSAVLCWVLCAVSRKDATATIAGRVHRLLKKAGQLVIIENNPAGFGTRFASFSVDLPASFSPKHSASVNVHLLGSSGEVQVSDFYWPDQEIRSIFERGERFRQIERRDSPTESPSKPSEYGSQASVSPFRILMFRSV